MAVSAVLFMQIKASNPRSSTIAPILLSPTPALPDQSSLSFSPESLYLKLGQASEAAIQINSQGRFPTLIQLEIGYDPQVITQTELTPDTFFANPQILLNNNDEQTGRLSYALSLPPDETVHLEGGRLQRSESHDSFQVGMGKVAKLKFTVKKNTSAKESLLNFLPKTEMLSQNTNIPLEISNGLKIYITNPTPTASPSSFLR